MIAVYSINGQEFDHYCVDEALWGLIYELSISELREALNSNTAPILEVGTLDLNTRVESDDGDDRYLVAGVRKLTPLYWRESYKEALSGE